MVGRIEEINIMERLLKNQKNTLQYAHYDLRREAQQKQHWANRQCFDDG